MKLKYIGVISIFALSITSCSIGNKETNIDNFSTDFKSNIEIKNDLFTDTSLLVNNKEHLPPYLRGKRSLVCAADSSNARNAMADLVKLSDNKLLLAYTKYGPSSDDWRESEIAGKISNNGGQTWGEPFTIQENIGKLNVMNPSFLRLNTGDLLLFFLVWNTPADCKLYLKKSTDNGKSWNDPSAITDINEFFIVNNGRVVQLSNGRIIAPFSHMKSNADDFCLQDVSCVFSDDLSKTWQYSESKLSFKGSPAMEPGIIELSEGKTMMYIRTMLKTIYYSYSEDHGNTWTIQHQTSIAAGSAPACIKKLPYTNDLLFIWNPIPFSPKNPYDRSLLTCAVSNNKGKSLKKIKTVEFNKKYGFAYPSITIIDDKIYLTYYMEDLNDSRVNLIVNIVELNDFYVK